MRHVGSALRYGQRADGIVEPIGPGNRFGMGRERAVARTRAAVGVTTSADDDVCPWGRELGPARLPPILQRMLRTAASAERALHDGSRDGSASERRTCSGAS